jgi:hypothetical protein
MLKTNMAFNDANNILYILFIWAITEIITVKY